MEITNGQWPQPWQNSSQNSVFWRGAKCYLLPAEFLLHYYKKIIKSKFRSSNSLLNSAEYAIEGKIILVSLPKHLARTRQQCTQILPVQQKYIVVRPGPSLPLSVSLLSVYLYHRCSCPCVHLVQYVQCFTYPFTYVDPV
jgi:hypothetical protein